MSHRDEDPLDDDPRRGPAPAGANPQEEDDAPDDAVPGTGDDLVTLPIESVLDLHSFQPKEVESVVTEYLEEARHAGFREIRIIHGRGIGVQREIVRKVLGRTTFVLSFQDAPAGWGGWGATIAILAPEGPANP